MTYTKCSRFLDPPPQSERCCGKKCRAGENRSQISRMASWPHRHSCSGGKQSGSGWAGKQVGEGEEGNGTLHILLICDLFPPALQFLSKAALTLVAGHEQNISARAREAGREKRE